MTPGLALGGPGAGTCERVCPDIYVAIVNKASPKRLRWYHNLNVRVFIADIKQASLNILGFLD